MSGDEDSAAAAVPVCMAVYGTNVVFQFHLQAVLRSVRMSVRLVAKSIGEGRAHALTAALLATVFPMTLTWEGTH